MRRIGLIAGLNLLALAFYAFIAIQMGFFAHMHYTLFWSPDASVYRDVGNWLLGAGPNTEQTKFRPFLFPLLLGLSIRIGGDWGIWGLNLICWLGYVNLTAEAVRRMTGRLWLGVVAFAILATNISIIVLSFTALTEPTNALLEAAWILGLAVATLPPSRSRDIVMLILPLVLMTLVRPGNELVLLVAAPLLAIAIWRMPHGRGAAVLATAACSVPLIFQLGLMAVANHYFGLSAAGAIQFKDFYASQVYALVNHLPDDLIAANQAVDPMGNIQLAGFLLSHPAASVNIFISNLHQNLVSGSNFVRPDAVPGLATAVRRANKAYVILDLIFVPIVAIAMVIKRDLRLILLTLFLAILVGEGSLINTQGDRYIDMAVPLWVAAYALAFSDWLTVGSRAAARRRRRTLGAV
jgi:hypothetical protein